MELLELRLRWSPVSGVFGMELGANLPCENDGFFFRGD